MYSYIYKHTLQKYTAASKKCCPHPSPQTDTCCHAASEHFSPPKPTAFNFLCTSLYSLLHEKD